MVMDFLTPCADGDATRWHQRLRDPAARRADPALDAAADVIERMHRRAELTLPWCGPLDDNPGNVMCGPDGQITFVDLFYVRGRVLYAKALEAPDEVVAAIPADRRRHMFEIPAMIREASPDEIARMRLAIAEADAAAR